MTHLAPSCTFGLSATPLVQKKGLKVNITFEKLRQVAENVDGSVYPDYSGRGMYGATCVGIVLEDSTVADLALAIKDAGADEILTREGRSSDNMGLRTIIYWTGVTCEDTPEDYDI